jgi:acyl carrier protein phosphodiesterase
MNYLAHAYLSFGKPGIVAGNMISDFVKGKKKFDYPPVVQCGMTLHRMIDAFTDEHSVTKEAKSIFKPFVGLYAGAFMDVVYDHFLATDQQEFPNGSLAEFSQNIYQILYAHINILPDRFAAMLPYMKNQDWLYNYSNADGIEKSFEGVVRRAAYLDSSKAVFEAFLRNYDELREYYQAFFPSVKTYAFSQLTNFSEVWR